MRKWQQQKRSFKTTSSSEREMKSDLINLIFINSYLALQVKNLQKRPSDTSHIDHHKLYLQDRKNHVGIHLSKYIPVHYDPYFSTFQQRILNFPVQNFSSTEKGAFPVHFPVHFPLKYIEVHSSTFKYGWPPCIYFELEFSQTRHFQRIFLNISP